MENINTDYKRLISSLFSCNISNTRDSVSSGYPNTEKRAENTAWQRGIFDDISGVWVAYETHVVCHLHRKTGWSTVVVNGTRRIPNGNFNGDVLVPFPRLFPGR